MQALSHNDFADILTAVYNGNRSAAEQTAENTSSVNTDYLSEYDRIKQNRINFDLCMFRRINCNQ